jgi:PAS domain S-box-containing protein
VGGPTYRAYHEARRERRAVSATEFFAPLGRHFEARAYPMDDDVVVVFRDVSGVRVAQEEVRELADRLSEAERIVGFGVWRWDIATGVVLWSDELHHIYGVRPGEFGGTVEDFVGRLHPDDRDRVAGHIADAVRTLEPFVFEERILRPDDTERRLLSQGRVIPGPDGAAATLVGVCHDVTERVQAERALGLSERRMRAIIDNSPSVIAVKGLDGRYLMANAEAGRLAGLPADELIGRPCTELFEPDVADRVREAERAAVAGAEPVFAEAVVTRDGEPRTYVVVTFPLPDDEGRPVEVCTIATDVTEQRERAGERREREEWQARISGAIAEGRMVLYAQPIVEVATGTTSSSELLVRMRSAGDPAVLLQPGSFLPAAERFGLIQAIDAWVVRQALLMAVDRRLEVNLSAVTLSDPEARREILALLSAAPGAAANLVLEVTETAVAGHIEAASEFAADIAALGCGLSLDDFGTGFGSFTYLRRLPLRYLKIDRTFVSGLRGSRDDRRVVQSILGIARQFGLSTIAEGVEDEATLELLREMGADFVQGFHLGRPAPIE